MGKWLNYRHLHTRLILGFIVIFILVLGMSFANIISINQINSHTRELIDRDVDMLMLNENLSVDMLDQTNLLQTYALTGDDHYRSEFLRREYDSLALNEEALEKSDTERLNTAIEQKIEWSNLTDKFFTLYVEGNQAAAMDLFEEEIAPLGTSIINQLQQLANHREGHIAVLGNEIIEFGEGILTTSFVSAFIIIVIGLIIAIITTKAISKPIKVLSNQMLEISSGDLTGQLDESKRKDEVGQLHQAIRQMVLNMRHLLSEVQQISDTVSEHSEAFSNTTKEASVSGEQISTTMQELASGAETQAFHATNLSSRMAEFATSVSIVQQLSGSIDEETQDIRRLSVDGAGLMADSVEQMRSIDSIVKDSVEQVVQLNNQANEVSKIMAVIQDIADQTNLLALNASIEAARAGEHGKGFAVVAVEVRKLAEQVGSSVAGISEIVSGIQSGSDSVKTSLEESYQQVSRGTNRIEETGVTFNSIEKAIAKTSVDIEGIAGQLTNMLDSTQSLIASIEEMASISQEAAAASEETAAAGEEVSGSVGEIATSATKLADLGAKMNELMKQFKLK